MTRDSFSLAVRNIASQGDTDVFPFPVENRVFHDMPDDVVDVLQDKIHRHFATWIQTRAPVNESTLAMVGYTGFRWVTQIDPLWNAYLLGLVLEMAPSIETHRVPREKEVAFSYRFEPDPETGRLFAEDGYASFRDRSRELAEQHPYVVTADIADFYSRVYHHSVENALMRLRLGNDLHSRVMDILKSFSSGVSYGVPVGGPAARILTELVLTSTDKLLLSDGMVFCRYADDYHIFAATHEDAYGQLISLSDKLFRNEGLPLQKSKSRVMTSAEFLHTAALVGQDGEDDEGHPETREFLRLSLRYDQYSATAAEDYDLLKTQVSQFDIVGMLAREVAKSRVHTALTRRLVRAVNFVDESLQGAAVETLVKNLDVLAPVLPSVLRALAELTPRLEQSVRESVRTELIDRVRAGSHIMKVDLNRAYAVRVLAQEYSEEAEQLLTQIFEAASPDFIKRDVVVAMANWSAEHWLRDKKTRYAHLGSWVKRAFIISSYRLGDEGQHWRRAVRGQWDEFDMLVAEWAAARVPQGLGLDL